MIYVVKCSLFRCFIQTSSFHGLPFLGQLRQERVIYLKRKPYYPLFERSFKIQRFCAMKSLGQVLLEVVLFQSRGRGHPQSDATPHFFLEYKCSILRLSNKILFVCKFFCKSGKNLEKKKSIISPNVSNCHKLLLRAKA